MCDIKISEKHGLNPSLMICPVCGKATNIALFGKIKGDKKAPRKILGDICDDCLNTLGNDKVYVFGIDDRGIPIKYTMINKPNNKDIPESKVYKMHLEEFNVIFKDS